MVSSRLSSTAIAALACAAGHASTFYVSPTGSNSNAGTLAKPWKTIQFACDEVDAGGTVYVETGVYNETVVIQRSMTLAAAPNAKPVIDGAGLAVPANNAALVLINNLSDIYLEGFELRNFKTTVSSNTPAAVLVQGAGNSIRILDNTIHNIENDGADANSINAFSIAVYGNSSSGAITDLSVDGNTIYDTKTGSSENLTLNGNVDGFSVEGNTVHDVNNIGIDCIGFEGTSPIKGQDQARNGQVIGNTVYNVTSGSNPAYHGSLGADGIYVDGGANILIERNTVHNADIGIEVASEHLSHYAYEVTAKDNLVYGCNLVGLSIGGYAANVGGTRDCSFLNNTLEGDDTTMSGSGEVQIQYNTSGNLFANNVLSATSQGILISGVTGADSAPGVASNYNLFYAPANMEWDWNGSSYYSLSSFSAGTGNDKQSFETLPGFVNAATGDFRLVASSPGIASGHPAYTSATDLDLAGSARLFGGEVDMGCYELPYCSLTGLTVKPASGGLYTGTVTLSAAAKGPGLVVRITFSKPDFTLVDGNPVVKAGAKTATFSLKPVGVTAATAVTVTATLGTVSKTEEVTLEPRG